MIAKKKASNLGCFTTMIVAKNVQHFKNYFIILRQNLRNSSKLCHLHWIGFPILLYPAFFMLSFSIRQHYHILDSFTQFLCSFISCLLSQIDCFAVEKTDSPCWRTAYVLELEFSFIHNLGVSPLHLLLWNDHFKIE